MKLLPLVIAVACALFAQAVFSPGPPAGKSGAATITFGTIGAGEFGTQTLTVTGAVAGNVVAVGCPSGLPDNVPVTGRVTTANTVQLSALNGTGASVTLGALNFSVLVF
jgi:hypothetical protein